MAMTAAERRGQSDGCLPLLGYELMMAPTKSDAWTSSFECGRYLSPSIADVIDENLWRTEDLRTYIVG